MEKSQSCNRAITRSHKGLQGPSRSSRSYSCPEPMWVANRRGREGTMAATLFPEVSCSPTQKPTGQRCHMTRQREAELSKSLNHKGQAPGKIWLLPLWVAPTCKVNICGRVTHPAAASINGEAESGNAICIHSCTLTLQPCEARGLPLTNMLN